MDYKRWKFDASGRSVETAYRWYQSVPSPQIDRTETIVKTYDGDGLDTKRVDTKDFILYPGGTQSTSSTEYYVRSTVLGGKLLTELDQAGAKKLTNVYAGDGVLAEQRIIGGAPGVFWRHEDSITGSYRKIGQNGEEGGSLADSPANVEYDPLGGAIPTIDPLTDPLLSQPSSMRQFKSAGDVNRPEYGCVIDGEMRKDVGACSRALKHGIGRLSENFDQPLGILDDLGIVARWIPTKGKPKPDAPDSPDVIRVTTQEPGGHWEYSFVGGPSDVVEIDPPINPYGGDCPYQSFSIFTSGSLGATASELNEIVRTAVGEASTYYAELEVTKIIHIMENMMTHNIHSRSSASPDYTWRTFGQPKSGSTEISAILGEFDAYKKHANRGPQKLLGQKVRGILPDSSVACLQIVEAVAYLTSGKAIGFEGNALHVDNVLQNRGVGAYSKYLDDLKLLYRIGDTDFWTYKDMRVRRPRR